MPRQARITTEYQHLIVRGIGKQILFESHDDYRFYLSLLKKYSSETKVTILAYCLMDNHVHLLVHNRDNATPLFMQKMGVTYAGYYNQKYERSGHLFQDRYKSEAVTDDRYLLTVYRYILNNPAKAGICAASEYPWSSYRDYIFGGISDPSLLRKMIGGSATFATFMEQTDTDEPMEYTTAHGDTYALSVIQRELHITSGTQLQHFAKSDRDAALSLLKSKGLTIRQLERLTGINRGIIQRANHQ